MDISKNFNLPKIVKNDLPKDDNKETTESSAPDTGKPKGEKTPPKKAPSTLTNINVFDYLFPEANPAAVGETETPSVDTPETVDVESPDVNETDSVDENENVKLTNDVDQLTEEEAIEQGYTIIKTAEDLAGIINNLSGKYIIMNDIDLSGVDWTPIGSEENPFEGILNGNGHKISNMTINANNGTETSNVGFIGKANNASISNLVLENAVVTTPETYNKGSVGALIGEASNVNIDNVSVSGKVTGHQKTGGLIGSLSEGEPAESSSITNSKVFADVTSSYYAGGLVGYIDTFSGGNNVMIENSSVQGKVKAKEKCAGGFIGEAGSTIVTINKSSCGANINGVDGADRIGGFIGCANGTKIAICNSNYSGSISAEGDFQGKNYGYYMNDAHVSIFELSAGLPADDILMIDGVDSLKPVYDKTTGKYSYEVSVSTLTGLDKVVAEIRKNPALADLVTFNVNFDFETMDGEYSPSVYAQYGVVQHQYEDEQGNVKNDVYIDNEMDVYSTFHQSNTPLECTGIVVPLRMNMYEKTMVEGLYVDQMGNYYVSTAYGMVATTLRFFFDHQQTNVETRLDEDQVTFRDCITNMVKAYQQDMHTALKDTFNYDGKSNYIIGEPEYAYLKTKQANGEEFTDLESLQFSVYELDMKIVETVENMLHNNGCGMGGDSSFLEADTAEPLYDEDGKMRFQTLNGTELRQQMDEDNNPILNDDGEFCYENLDGEPWSGQEPVFVVRGYPKTDEQGNFLYSDESGATVTRTKNMDGSFSYSNEDGTAYDGDTEALQKQLDEYSPADEYQKLQTQMQELLKEYQEKNGQK